ncbi:MAG TPA: APC family permease [Xanthobacteraceae bacterium]
MAAAVSIGIGGMVGAGIFSILGVVAQAAGNAMWLAFAIGGVVALLSTYSYAKLGATFPSAGGAVHFLVKSFGDGVLAGGLNLFMWAGYIISLALYATAFGGYAATFVTTAASPLLVKSLAVAAIVLLTLLNAFGARLMGRWETVIVAVKLAILVLFAAVGLWFIRPGYLSPELWPESTSILFGAGVLFIGYEGFGLVTNAAGDMRDPRKMLPRALYTSVLLVIALYLAVSLTVTGNLSDYEIEQSKDYALAEAAKPFLGQFGFRLIAIAALFSTASAINATLFGAANVCYMIARDGGLPAGLSRTEWRGATGGLVLTAVLVLAVMLSFDLSGIAMMGSAAFLLIYAAVNAGHLKVLKQTGASAPLVWLSLLTCLAMFVVLCAYIAREQPRALAALVAIAAASFLAEWAYRRLTGRVISEQA